MSSVREKRSVLPDFITNLFPTNKPERGGTLRQHGVWGSHNSENPNWAYLPASFSRRPIGGATRLPDNPQAFGNAVPGSWPTSADAEDPSFLSSTQDPPKAAGERARRRPVPSVVPASQGTVSGDQTSVPTSSERSRESHLQRRSLKESGDFLGVQGVNPETGQLDVLTPTTGSDTTLGGGMPHILGELSRDIREAKSAHRTSRKLHPDDLRKALSEHASGGKDRFEREKDNIRREQSLVRWRKDTIQWSSVAEPILGSIAQSSSSLPCE